MKKVLVANRGEIAVRVLRTLKEMGIKTVSIYSEADRLAPHVIMADEAVCIGPPPSNQSYLLGKKIIDIAKSLNVDGIHPGYGFLSENAEFSKAVNESGITFIGPSPSSILTMGNKLMAKKAVSSYNIPLVPGTESALKDKNEALEVSKKIGFPLLIKAAAGGGGKGMRVVHNEGEIEEQIQRAINEAESSFGDGRVFIEKYIQNPRHIEVQILADNHGNIIHLFERECSIQRRHQKVIEEAPSAIINDSLREKLGKCAIDVARSCDYSGAGTVEFIMDEKKDFFFLEMNTRLQVEHPITEMITGVDLVKEQIEIARNKKLNIKQEDIQINGHAIELRVCAEDPYNNFLPDTGSLDVYMRPQGPGVRVDDGLRQGMDISIYYDPMIAKLIVHSFDRKSAIEKMKRAIEEYNIQGVKTTLGFGAFVLDNRHFKSGDFDTHFIEKHFDPDEATKLDKKTSEIAALASILIYNDINKPQKSIQKTSNTKQKYWLKNRKK